MQESIQYFINAVFNLLLFCIVPFLWWVFFHRKKEKFLSWIGIKKPAIHNKRIFILLFSLFLIISVFSNFLPTIVDRSLTGTGQIKGMGISALFQALLFGLIQTGASEEILFRGFLAKRFIKRFGFFIGNTMQAVLFGLLHIAVLYLATSANIYQGFLVFIVPCLGGWFFGYVNEKQSEGSIIPSWLMHGIGNVLASIIAILFFR